MPEHTPGEVAKNIADPGRPARLRSQGVRIPPAPVRTLPAQAQSPGQRGGAAISQERREGRQGALKRRLR